MLNINKLQPH